MIMCGIFGTVNLSGVKDSRLAKYFADAQVAGTLRGTDSYGSMQYRHITKKERTVYYSHSLTAGAALAVGGELPGNSKGDAASIASAAGDFSFSVGHHRAATTGGVTLAACHPHFVEKNAMVQMAGVHNGTVSGWSGSEQADEHTSDSSWIMQQLYDKGPETLASIVGPTALVWLDLSKDGSMFLYTNGGRELHFARVAKDKFLIASEAAMLWWLASRNNIPLMDDEIMQCQGDVLYTINGEGAGYSQRKLKAAEEQRVSLTSKPHVGKQIGWGRTAVSSCNTAANYATWGEDWDEGFNYNTAYSIKHIVKEAIKKARAADRAPRAGIIPTPTPGVLPAGGVTTRPPACTPEESKALKGATGLSPGAEVVFDAHMWEADVDNAERGTLLGEIIVEDVENPDKIELYLAAIRHVSKAMSSLYLEQNLVAKAIGVEKVPMDGGGLSLNVLCSPRVTILRGDKVCS